MDWPEWVEVDELNWGPIAVVQQFQALNQPYTHVVLLGAIQRSHRKIGEIDVFVWQGGLPSETQIQACIGDAATGVISVENLLVIGEYFKIWPKSVYLVDVEPGPEMAGDQLSYESDLKTQEILELVKTLVLTPNNCGKNIKEIRGETIFSAQYNG